MAKFNNFVQCNLFCCKIKVKFVLAYICPKLKGKGIVCKPNIFINLIACNVADE